MRGEGISFALGARDVCFAVRLCGGRTWSVNLRGYREPAWSPAGFSLGSFWQWKTPPIVLGFDLGCTVGGAGVGFMWILGSIQLPAALWQP